jgi:acyl-CoA reductase-like NAD-dependent aldehyde dehydrogenase
MDEYPGDVRLFINGCHVDGTGEGRQQVRSPVSGDVIGSVPVPGPADIDAAVAAANAAQARWGRTGVWERAKICHAIGDALTARGEELARLQTLEQGKPLQESRGRARRARRLRRRGARRDRRRAPGGPFTRDISKAYRFVEELAVGQVVVNDSTCWWDINMPFGGAGGRRTGWGRIGGKHTLLGMADLRTAAIHLS